MPAPLPLGDDSVAPLDPIEFTPTVALDFHPGAVDGVWWATLHIGRQAVEIGTVRGVLDLDSVLTMAAGVIMERPAHADDVFVSPDGTERWVLIGSWVLNARMTSRPNHVHYGSHELARAIFTRLAEHQL